MKFPNLRSLFVNNAALILGLGAAALGSTQAFAGQLRDVRLNSKPIPTLRVQPPKPSYLAQPGAVRQGQERVTRASPPSNEAHRNQAAKQSAPDRVDVPQTGRAAPEYVPPTSQQDHPGVEKYPNQQPIYSLNDHRSQPHYLQKFYGKLYDETGHQIPTGTEILRNGQPCLLVAGEDGNHKVVSSYGTLPDGRGAYHDVDHNRLVDKDNNTIPAGTHIKKDGEDKVLFQKDGKFGLISQKSQVADAGAHAQFQADASAQASFETKVDIAIKQGARNTQQLLGYFSANNWAVPKPYHETSVVVTPPPPNKTFCQLWNALLNGPPITFQFEGSTIVLEYSDFMGGTIHIKENGINRGNVGCDAQGRPYGVGYGIYQGFENVLENGNTYFFKIINNVPVPDSDPRPEAKKFGRLVAFSVNYATNVSNGVLPPGVTRAIVAPRAAAAAAAASPPDAQLNGKPLVVNPASRPISTAYAIPQNGVDTISDGPTDPSPPTSLAPPGSRQHVATTTHTDVIGGVDQVLRDIDSWGAKGDKGTVVAASSAPTAGAADPNNPTVDVAITPTSGTTIIPAADAQQAAASTSGIAAVDPAWGNYHGEKIRNISTNLMGPLSFEVRGDANNWTIVGQDGVVLHSDGNVEFGDLATAKIVNGHVVQVKVKPGVTVADTRDITKTIAYVTGSMRAAATNSNAHNFYHGDVVANATTASNGGGAQYSSVVDANVVAMQSGMDAAPGVSLAQQQTVGNFASLSTHIANDASGSATYSTLAMNVPADLSKTAAMSGTDAGATAQNASFIMHRPRTNQAAITPMGDQGEMTASEYAALFVGTSLGITALVGGFLGFAAGQQNPYRSPATPISGSLPYNLSTRPIRSATALPEGDTANDNSPEYKKAVLDAALRWMVKGQLPESDNRVFKNHVQYMVAHLRNGGNLQQVREAAFAQAAGEPQPEVSGEFRSQMSSFTGAETRPAAADAGAQPRIPAFLRGEPKAMPLDLAA